MGCDIHLYVEIKINNKWHFYADVDVQRDYTLFEKMAGVEGDVSCAISPPKGLPDDISFVTKLSHDIMKADAHSESYLTEEELIRLNEWLKIGDSGLYGEFCVYIFGESLIDYFNYPEDRPDFLQEVRFVFWFDN